MEKRGTLCFVITVLFVASVIFSKFFLENLGKEFVPEVPIVVEKKKEKVYDTYDMYVSIIPFVKLTFRAEYETCDNTYCFTGNAEVIDFELINDDAKTIYNELNFKGMKVIDVIILLCDVARENNIAYDSVSITTNWMDMYDDEVLKNEIIANSKYELNYDIFVDIREYIDEEEMIQDTENDEIVEYIVSFNRDNGDSIIKRKVKENEVVQEVKSGNKSGYTFVEWQLDGKKYDFNTPVTKDITLVAKWKKGEETTTTTTTTININDNAPTQTTASTTKPKSTIDKINLNDEIMVSEVTENNKNYCNAQGWLATNFTEVFAKYLHGNNFAVYVENEEDNFDELILSLMVDDSKISTLLNQLDSIKSGNNPNIVNFNYNYNSSTHKFSYSYQYLSSSNFSNILNNKKVNNVVNNSIVNWTGELCSGASKPEEKKLDEALCSKYNLNCDRW